MLKKIFAVIFAALCTVLCVSSAFADNSAIFESDSNKVNITFECAYADYALIIITERVSGSCVYANQVSVINGIASDTAYLDIDIKGGYYDVEVTDNLGNIYRAEFFSMSEEYKTTLLEEISGLILRTDKGRYTEFENLLENNPLAFQYDKEKLSDVEDKESFWRSLLSGRYSSVDEFSARLRTLIYEILEQQELDAAVKAFNDASAQTMTVVLEKYAEVYGIALDNVYYKYESPVNIQLASKTASSNEDIAGFFAESMAIPYLNEAERADLLDIISEYDKYLEIYDLITKQSDEVIIKILKQISLSTYTYASEVQNDVRRIVSESSQIQDTVSKYQSTSYGTYTIPKSWFDAASRPKIIQDSESGAENMPFTDLADVPWAVESIRTLKEKGIINGKSDLKFAPNDNITRAEFVKMLVLAFLIKTDGETQFKDISDSDWFYEYAVSAENAGIVNGDNEKNFMPLNNVTRQDAAVMIFRCMDKEPIENVTMFDDDVSIAEYAKEAVYYMRAKGVINGTGENYFEPAAFLSRAQCAKMLCLAMNME